jgi:hypothetical protein
MAQRRQRDLLVSVRDVRKFKGLFFETSAQIARLLTGSSEMLRGIEELTQATPKVGSSMFVLSEFTAVVGRMYSDVSGALEQLSGPNRQRSIFDMWKEVVECLRYSVSGGAKLLSDFSAELSRRYGSRLVSPNEVRTFVNGQRLILLEYFFLFHGTDIRTAKTFFDNSTCCAWKDSEADPCLGNPTSECKLQRLCVSNREMFLASIKVLANANREESDWLAKNLQKLSDLNTLSLLRRVGEKPGHFGDVIIFMETPSNWILFSKDKTFHLLREKLRTDIAVFNVRLPRIPLSANCTVRLLNRKRGPMDGRIVDYCANGMQLISDGHLAGKGARVVVSTAAFPGNKYGTIVRSKKEKSGMSFGIRISAQPTNRKKKLKT